MLANKKDFEQFESLFSNNLVLALDNMFAHRAKELKKKNGTALNELRLICDSILNHGGIFLTKSIKFDHSRTTRRISCSYIQFMKL